MKILTGKQVINMKEAFTLVFQTAGVDEISADVLDMFESIANNVKTNGGVDKIIGTGIRSRYGNKATWRTEQYYVPVPKLRYDSKDIPQLVIEITVYIVAVAVVKTPGVTSMMGPESRFITLVGSVSKPETLYIPMVFLHALLEKDLGRFNIIARDASSTTWEITGAKPVRIPNDFISELMEVFKWQSVVSWLEEFGAQGRYVSPLVAGNLIGLAFQNSGKPIPLSHEVVTEDKLVAVLESLDYKPAEAREMVKRAAPYLRADMTLEEAVKTVLQTGKGGS